MREKFIAANWKMHLTLQEAVHLMKSIIQKLTTINVKESIIFIPPSIYLYEINKILQMSNSLSIDSNYKIATLQKKNISFHKNFALGAQNLYTGVYGAFTGEVSASMLASVGVKYVLIGHSERRKIFHENNTLLSQKIDSALKEDLSVIFCCGEDRNTRDSGNFLNSIEKQICDSLFHLSIESIANVILAYEPIWAIGTGITPTIYEIEEVCAHIRSVLSSKFGTDIAEKISILYGGSCNTENAKSFYNISGIDGLLVGGASLTCDSFYKIIENICYIE